MVSPETSFAPPEPGAPTRPVEGPDFDTIDENIVDLEARFATEDTELPTEPIDIEHGSLDALNSEEFQDFNSRLDAMADAYKSRQVPADMVTWANDVAEAPRREMIAEAEAVRDQVFEEAKRIYDQAVADHDKTVKDAEAAGLDPVQELAAIKTAAANLNNAKKVYDQSTRKAQEIFDNKTNPNPKRFGSADAILRAEAREQADTYANTVRNGNIVNEAVDAVASNGGITGDSLTEKQLANIDYTELKNRLSKISSEAGIRKFLAENPKVAEGLYLERIREDKKFGNRVEQLSRFVMKKLGDLERKNKN